jgi:microcystin degradation protein MlrC
MAEAMADAERIARDHALLSFTVFHGFGYADTRDMGAAVLAVADGDEARAGAAADELAAALWSRRDRLRGSALATAAAVAEADRRAEASAPVVLLDVGDNIGGGGPGSSTVLLAEALARRVRGFVAPLSDRDAAQRLVAAGAGAEAELNLGGAHVRGRVTRVTDGRFEARGPVHGGHRYFDGGPTARLSGAGGLEVVVSTRRVSTVSPDQLGDVGIEPAAARVIAAKGVVAPRAGFEAVAGGFVLADTPGVTAADLSLLPYRRRRRPLWPLEPIEELAGAHAR